MCEGLRVVFVNMLCVKVASAEERFHNAASRSEVRPRILERVGKNCVSCRFNPGDDNKISHGCNKKQVNSSLFDQIL